MGVDVSSAADYYLFGFIIHFNFNCSLMSLFIIIVSRHLDLPFIARVTWKSIQKCSGTLHTHGSIYIDFFLFFVYLKYSENEAWDAEMPWPNATQE